MDIFVDCRDQIRSGRRWLFDAVEAAAACVAHDDSPPGLPTDASVVPVFQSAHALFIDVDIAQNVRGHFPLWIKAVVLLLKIDARKFPSCERDGFGDIDLSLDPHERSLHLKLLGKLVSGNAK